MRLVATTGGMLLGSMHEGAPSEGLQFLCEFVTCLLVCSVMIASILSFYLGSHHALTDSFARSCLRTFPRPFARSSLHFSILVSSSIHSPIPSAPTLFNHASMRMPCFVDWCRPSSRQSCLHSPILSLVHTVLSRLVRS